MKAITIKVFCLHLLLAGFIASQTNPIFSKSSNSLSTDSLITSIVSEINSDSIRSYIQSLQDFKTRMVIAPNKDSVVNWLVNKFKSFGLTDVEIDTCTGLVLGTYNIPALQKNIVATLKGTVDSNEVFVIGGHYDSMNNKGADPMISAPGADDNASGVSSVLECARVIMEKGYKPNATIKFIAYDGEELCHPSGSKCFADKILGQGKKVILAINSDMIANSTLPLKNSAVQIFYNPSDFLFYKNLSEFTVQGVSVLNVISKTDIVSADNGEFFSNKIPTIDFMEDQFNGTLYHSSNDLVENYNMEYCTEIIKIICATLISAIESNLLPKPIYILIARPKLYKIELQWRPYSETRVNGFNIYRGLALQGEKIKLNTEVIKDTSYLDDTAQNGIYYFYEVKAVDSMGRESNFNKIVKARAISLDQGILVVDETKDGTGALTNPSDAQVDTFYSQLLYNFNKKDFDIVKDGYVTLSDLGAFSSILWHGNDDVNLLAFKNSEDIKKYLEAGGKLLFDSFLPSKALVSNIFYEADYNVGDFMYDVFKIKHMERKPNTLFFSAKPIDLSYNLLEVDTTKTAANLKYHLLNIESISAAPGGKEIYNYDTKYDSASSKGSMKGLPVGVEYLGSDYKVITLSFPLYYMNQEQAKELVQNIMLNKFNEATGVERKEEKVVPAEYFLYQNYPNPFNPSTTIHYQIPAAGFVVLKVYDVLGREVATLVNEEKPAGRYRVEFNASSRSAGFSSGIYFYQLRTGNFVSTKKMLVIK